MIMIINSDMQPIVKRANFAPIQHVCCICLHYICYVICEWLHVVFTDRRPPVYLRRSQAANRNAHGMRAARTVGRQLPARLGAYKSWNARSKRRTPS